MKDITVDQLQAGETGLFEGVEYIAADTLQRGSCDGCDFGDVDTCDPNIKCDNITFRKSVPDSKMREWMRSALASDPEMKIGIETVDIPVQKFISDINICIVAGATHVNADIQVDGDGIPYVRFYALRKPTAEEIRAAKIAELRASIEAAQAEIDRLEHPAADAK